MTGLRGTGSKDLVVAAPVLVPWHRVPFTADTGSRQAPGQVAASGSSYRAPVRAVAAFVLAPPALGAARSVLARFGARLHGHRQSLVGRASQRQDPAARLRVVESAADIDAAAIVFAGAYLD